MYYESNNYLQHYGIKGMKWGVRRYQNKDGSLTSAGKKRYDYEDSGSKENAQKRNLLQRRHDKLVEHYKGKGYGDNAAEIAAKRRLKAELVVGGVATVAVAAIATKAAIRIGQDYCDKTIKSGKVIQNIGANEKATFKDAPFYAAINKHDKKAYGALYPNEKKAIQQRIGGADTIFNNKIKITKDVKRASVNNARNIFYNKMEKDPEFRKGVLDTMKNTKYYDDSVKDYIANGKRSKKLYDRFNQALATPEMQKAGINKQFYSALQKKGYNAILDINDTRYSGYKKIAKNPTIFFGDDKWEKISSMKLDDEKIVKNATNYLYKDYVAKNAAKELAISVGAKATSTTIENKRLIEKYLDEHPDTKLSEKEILKIAKKKHRK